MIKGFTDTKIHQEDFHTGVKNYAGRYFEIYKNPTQRELRDILDGQTTHIYRAILSQTDSYVFNQDLTHSEAFKEIKNEVGDNYVTLMFDDTGIIMLTDSMKNSKMNNSSNIEEYIRNNKNFMKIFADMGITEDLLTFGTYDSDWKSIERLESKKYDLDNIKNELIDKYFNSDLYLKEVPIRYGKISKSLGITKGKIYINPRRTSVEEIVMSDLYDFEEDFLTKLICHELIHADMLHKDIRDIGGSHGLKFKTEIRRIKDMGLDVPLSEDLPATVISAENKLVTPVYFLAYEPGYALFFRSYDTQELSNYIRGFRSRYYRGSDIKLYFGKTQEAFIRKYRIGKSLLSAMKTTAGMKLEISEFQKLKDISEDIIITKNDWGFVNE